jgi:signal transduction histidine kinase
VLNEMLDRLRESMRQTAEFSADAAHQLRTPLARIRGKLDLMLRGELPRPLRTDIESLEEEVVRLTRLCSRLLLLGRLELRTGEANIMNERLDLREIAEELVEQCSPTAHERGVTLKIETAVVAWVRGNRILLVEALLNLIDNALRWTPSGGTVRVSVDANGRETTLSVADTGPGISDEERERIFRPFYRIGERSGAPASEGSGLGLAIVRSIARAHSGRVGLVPSRSSDGCVFRLTLPGWSAD